MMKIKRDFAPVTLVLEHECDLTDIRDILYSAYKQETSSRPVFCSSGPTDLQQKIQFLLDKLKL